ncbi:MAG: protein kinase, partial [Planctomycetota bacterium]
LLKEEGAGTNALARFFREAQSIANLSHPHILQLLQPARDAQGDYLVLEWAAGGSLRERLNKMGGLPAAEVRDIAFKIGGALAYAHTKGVIHRDIKPHNILLTETGEPKLADFGLARSVGDATLSSSRGGAGSPLYMPPEQYDSSRQTDARSDIYSLGKTLYQLLTNRSPATPQMNLLPRAFRKPLAHCMEDDPADRPASIGTFLEELRKGERRRPLWPVLVAAVVVIAAGYFFLRTGANQPQPTPAQTADSSVGTGVGGPGEQVNAGTPLGMPPAVLIAGLFAGEGGQKLDQAQETEADRVEIHLEFNPAPPDDHRPGIVVRRGDTELPAGEVGIVWGEGGKVVLSVPLSGKDNRFEVEVPDRSYESGTLQVTRMDPSPMPPEIAGAERIEGSGETYLTRQPTVELQVEVARARGISSLWLAQGKSKEQVAIKDGRITHTVALSDLENEFRWYWPDETSPLAAGLFRIVADTKSPELVITEPKAGLLTNASSVVIKGRVEDANPGDEIRWRLFQNGEARDEYCPSAAVNGNFDDSVTVPDGLEGELVLEFSATDRAGNPADVRIVTLTVDRTPPALREPPRFEPTFDENHHLVSVSLEGEANEALKLATCNGQEIGLLSGNGFMAKGLEPKPGEAYTLVLTDLAGNRSEPMPLAHGVDIEPPTAKFRFQERDGVLMLSIVPSEPLQDLVVEGVALGEELLTAETILARVSGSLKERTNWKSAAGPTNSPIEVTLTDPTGNATTEWLVICPEDRTAVRCLLNEEGKVAGTEPCPVCGGCYCPRTGLGGEHPLADGKPQDYWMSRAVNVCTYCNWPRP